VLTVTLFHEQYLGIGVGTNQSTAIAFHWSQGAALLNSKLSCAIEPSERDALWACAAMLGALVFSSIQAKTPEEAWPLWSSPSDLDWLTLCEGKKEIWKITNPMRKDSVFHSIIPNFLASPSACSNTDLRKLPPELIELCRLDDIPLQEDNPYLEPALLGANDQHGVQRPDCRNVLELFWLHLVKLQAAIETERFLCNTVAGVLVRQDGHLSAMVGFAASSFGMPSNLQIFEIVSWP
jgi:hypothetical protein